MGIAGLHQILKPIVEEAHVREFAGQVAGIDAFSWLHKGAMSCSYELCMGMPTDKYLKYCMGKVHMLLSNKVDPVLVFDGHALPMKGVTNVERAKSRKAHLARGKAQAMQGNRTAATECFGMAISITGDMIHQLQLCLTAAGVSFLVAPYEADVQLAYMSLNGLVDCVITEDSDLVVYGTKRVLYKMDNEGRGELILYCNIGSIEKPNMLRYTDPKTLSCNRPLYCTALVLQPCIAI